MQRVEDRVDPRSTVAGERGNVAAGHEGSTTSGQNDAAHVLAPRETQHDIPERLGGRRVERV